MRSMVPVVAASDRQAIATAFFLLRRHPSARLRVARIRDTLHLEHLQVSPALLEPEVLPANVTVEGEPAPLKFNEAGDLV